MKKSTYLLIIIALLGLLSSCGREDLTVTYNGPQTGASSTDVSFDSSGTDMIGGLNYSSGKRLSYLEANRLLTETVSESNGSTYYYVLSRISGLTDKHISSAVNDKISEISVSWCKDRPLPQSGLSETITEEMIANACYGASTTITLNSSDYFSGVIARTIDFYDPETMTHSLLTYDYPLNFDLRSGEEFSLEALFCDGTDYISVINTAILRYAKDNALSVKDFSTLPQKCCFSLGETGIIIYIDDNCQINGLSSGTKINVDYSAFGDSLVIERPCSDIYVDRDPAGIKLIRSSKSEEITTDTVYFDEGDKLSVKVSHISPQGFPETLFEEADKFAATYIPDDSTAEKIRTSASDFLRVSCTINGYYIGNYSCVDLKCSVKRNGEAPVSAIRSYVYDETGNELSAEKCFVDGFDLNTFISGGLANSVNVMMEDGWTIEEEIDINDIDFSIGCESFTFSTLPVRMTRKTVVDGAETSETRKESITTEARFDEIGIENMLVRGQ